MTNSAMQLLENGCTELGVPLDAIQAQLFASFGDELKRWNKAINLTAIESDEEIVVKHFLDSLTLAPYLKGDEALLDMGSGGGFPCIPLKIALPELKITSIDAVGKKVTFQRHAGRVLGFTAFTVLHARLEKPEQSLCDYFDVVTARAFASLGQIVKLARPYLKESGVLYSFKGDAEAEVAAAAEIMKEAGAIVREVKEISLPYSGDCRTILTVIYNKS